MVLSDNEHKVPYAGSQLCRLTAPLAGVVAVPWYAFLGTNASPRGVEMRSLDSDVPLS